MSLFREAKDNKLFSSKQSGRKYIITPKSEKKNIIDDLEGPKVFVDYIKSREKEESELDSTLKESGLNFDEVNISPYMYPLDGQVYYPNPSIGPSGMCPICYNSKSNELDVFFIKTFNKRSKWEEYPWCEKTIIDHLVRHVGLIYGHAAKEVADIRESIGGGLKPILDRAKYHTGQDIPHLVARRVSKAIATDRYAQYRERGERAEVPAEPPPGVIDRATENRLLHVSPSLAGRPDGQEAKKWYAYAGTEAIGVLRPWGDRRMANEIEAKSKKAVVFYDEMMTARKMFLDIYSEIMNTDIDSVNNDRGTKDKPYIERNYSAAVAAAREFKGVAMDMVKLAIITAKIGDEKDKMRSLSPSMKSMLSDIGVFADDDKELVDGEKLDEEIDSSIEASFEEVE